MGQIDRTGKISFHDASLNIMEEGLGGSHTERAAWEKLFKKQVFLRVIQQLNRLGWEVKLSAEHEKNYQCIAKQFRECSKGDLKAELRVSGRCIEFQMWQGINTPTRPDHGGRYESNKEEVAPYLLRLEMIRTRRKIANYLINIFSGYSMSDKHDGRHTKRGPNGATAMEYLQNCYKSSWHFKGDLSKYQITDGNKKSADKKKIEHGSRVWFYSWKGRLCTGIAYYNINNMWWVVSGKYAVSNEGSHDLYIECPSDIRKKNNGRLRRSRLESELSSAIKKMDFKRAEVLKNILFKDEKVYLVYHTDHKAYHCSNFSGYTTNIIDAGKFTLTEAQRHSNDINKIIPLENAA